MTTKTKKRIWGIFIGIGDRIDPLVIDDDDAVFFQKMGIAQGFQPLKSDQHVRLSFLHDGFCDGIAVADESDYTSAALCHAVNLGEFDVIACLCDDAAEDTACEQCTLTAHAYDHYIFSSHYLL